MTNEIILAQPFKGCATPTPQGEGRDGNAIMNALIRQMRQDVLDNERILSTIPTTPLPQSAIYRVEKSPFCQRFFTTFDFADVLGDFTARGIEGTVLYPGVVTFESRLITVQVMKVLQPYAKTHIKCLINNQDVDDWGARFTLNCFLRDVLSDWLPCLQAHFTPPPALPALPAPPDALCREARIVADFERTYKAMKTRGEVHSIEEWLRVRDEGIGVRRFNDWRKRYGTPSSDFRKDFRKDFR